jgi:glycosyltransferase involved in cell wall biosynthesis
VPRIAYLTNAYPKVSHSFIRREIAALERRGVEITRISIRRAHEQLPDPADAAELQRTIVLLDGTTGILRLLLATMRAAVTHPPRFLKALRLAHEMAGACGAGLGRHLAYLVEACGLVRILRARRIDHVHVHFGTNPAAVARLARTLSGISYSMTVHGPDEFDAPRALSLGGKIADASFTAGVSSFGRGQLMRWARVEDWPRIGVVRCGVDSNFFAQSNAAPPRAKRLVCVARLSAQKGLPLLLDAAARLAADGRDFELRLVGDGELRPQLEEQIRALRLDRQVEILGWRSNEDVRSEILGSRALVLPSFAEGLPVVIMEAMALSRPVIATAIAGIPELVDSECGWLVPSGSVDALAQAMAAALDATPEQLTALGGEARARAEKWHDADENAAVLLERLNLPRETGA